MTGDGLDFALETLGLADPVLRARIMGLYRTFKCFPEVPEVLLQLKQQGYITAILSNGLRNPAQSGHRLRWKADIQMVIADSR